MTLIPILAVLYFTTIFFGGFQIWVYSLAELFILGVSLFLLFFTLIKSYKKKQPIPLHFRDPITLAALVFLAYIAFQLVPLPPAFLKFLSPLSWEIWNRSPLPPGSYYPISIHPYATKHGLIFAFCLFLVYLWVVYGIRTRKQLNTLVIGLIIFGLAEVIYGSFENLSGRNHILWLERVGRNTDITGTIINHDHFASFLSLIICLGLGFFWSLFFLKKDTGKQVRSNKIILFIEHLFDTQGTKTLTMLLSLLIMTVGLLMTTSRGGTISLLVGIVFIIGVIISRRFKTAKTPTYIILVSLMLSFAAYMTLERVWDRFRDVESSLEVRWEITRGTWALHKDFPAFGSGLGTFENLFPKYQTDLSYDTEHAHNDWVEILAETGWIGFGIISFCLIYFFIRAIPNIKKQHDPLYIGLGMGGLGAILSISLHSLSEFSMHKPSIALLITIVLGITQIAIHLDHHIHVNNGQLKHFTLIIKNNSFPHLPFSKQFVLLFAIIVFLPISWFAGNSTIRHFFMSQLIRIESSVGLVPSTPGTSEVVRAINIDPYNGLGWYWLAISISEGNKVFIKTKDWGIYKHIISFNNNKKIDGIYEIPLYFREALSRQPSSQLFWRDLRSKSFDLFKLDPNYLDPQIRTYFENTCFFKPLSPIAWFEKGTFILSKENKPPYLESKTWLNDYRICLNLDLKYTSSVVDKLYYFQKMEGLKLLPQILPLKSKAWIIAGQSLLEKELFEFGEKIYCYGEKLKDKEVDELIKKIRTLIIKNDCNALLEELKSLDPENPWRWYFRGEILKALHNAWKRGIPFTQIYDLHLIEKYLIKLKETDPRNLLTINFCLALIKFEQKDYSEARKLLEQVLRINPNFFPALLYQEQLLKITDTSEREKAYLDLIEKKLNLFAMEEIPVGAWLSEKQEESDQKTYQATFRSRKAIQELKLGLPSSGCWWALFIENRFIAVKFVIKDSFKFGLPNTLHPGEHRIQLIQLSK
jgi:putative inorganic carbon (hco3(-)) transporter